LQKHVIAADTKAVALTARVELEMPVLQARVKEMEGDRLGAQGGDAENAGVEQYN
jgi:hypothetical protein